MHRRTTGDQPDAGACDRVAYDSRVQRLLAITYRQLKSCGLSATWAPAGARWRTARVTVDLQVDGRAIRTELLEDQDTVFVFVDDSQAVGSRARAHMLGDDQEAALVTDARGALLALLDHAPGRRRAAGPPRPPTPATHAVLVFDREGDFSAHASPADAAGYLEAIDVGDGEYIAAFSVDGTVCSIGVDRDTVVVEPTSTRDPAALRRALQTARDHFPQRVPHLDPAQIAAAELLWQWQHRWPRWPRWLDQRLHGTRPPLPLPAPASEADQDQHD